MKVARIPAKKKKSQSTLNEEEADDEMNDETDEVLIRISLCWHSVGILHLISPRYPPPAGRRGNLPECLAAWPFQ